MTLLTPYEEEVKLIFKFVFKSKKDFSDFITIVFFSCFLFTSNDYVTVFMKKNNL